MHDVGIVSGGCLRGRVGRGVNLEANLKRGATGTRRDVGCGSWRGESMIARGGVAIESCCCCRCCEGHFFCFVFCLVWCERAGV